MDWNHLRYVLAIARTGSLVASARSLGVSHSTISRQIQRFEDSLGTRVFERLPTGWVLTAAGEQLVDAAARFEHDLLTTERAIAGRDSQLFGPLRVAVPYLFGNHLLMPHLAAFADAHPDIELQVVASLNLMNLTRREADVAIRVTNRPPEGAIGRKVARLEWAVYASHDLLERCAAENRPPPYIGLDDDAPIPAWYTEQFPGAHLCARVNDPVLVLGAVCHGLGAGVLARCIADCEPDLHYLCNASEFDVDMWLLCHPTLRTTARVRAFMELMHEALRSALT